MGTALHVELTFCYFSDCKIGGLAPKWENKPRKVVITANLSFPLEALVTYKYGSSLTTPFSLTSEHLNYLSEAVVRSRKYKCSYSWLLFILLLNKYFH